MENVKKERTFTLQLSDRDLKVLYIKARRGGMTMEELLESFVCDLVRSKETNGSDERDRAEEWYEGHGFEKSAENSFLSYALQYENVETIVNIWKRMQEEERRLAMGSGEFESEEDMEASEEDVAYQRKKLERTYAAYEKHSGKKGRGFDEEIGDLLKWHEGWRKLSKGIMP